eukprot:scaffold18209_cov88-Skeletonema_dohrnii-CCMP3373.AAC.6
MSSNNTKNVDFAATDSDRHLSSTPKKKVKEAVTAIEQDWSDQGAPFPSQTFSPPQLLWFPFLWMVTKESIQALNNKNIFASIFWIIYESYIVFDHIPFLFTNSVYKSPRFNFTYISTIAFWGFEAIASIVSTQSLVAAPNVLLYNAVPHCFFIVANNFRGVAASKAFVVEQKKMSWVSLQVIVDSLIHCTSLFYHLKYILSSHPGILQIEIADASHWLCWGALMVSMLLLTYMVHKEEMKWSYFFAPFLGSMIETKNKYEIGETKKSVY